jgi:DNA-binding response OmpR family regulator
MAETLEAMRMGSDLTNMVVLVDDEPNIRETVAFILEAEGVEVSTGSDGVEGLEAVRRCRPKVVLLDVMMPRMDGYELTRALRAMPEYADIPIVMVTSRGERIDRVRGFDAGVDEYSTKPHDRQLLLRAVKKLLGHDAGDDDGPPPGGSETP